MFRAFLVFHDEVDLVTAPGIAFAAEACPCVGFGVELERWRFVAVPGAEETVVTIGM
jgi:hypothetical protein